MSQAGKTRKLGRIFEPKTDRAVIVAMDHGLFMGPLKGLADALQVVENVLKGGPNALVISPGLLRRLDPGLRNRVGLILRIDGATTVYSPDFFDNRLIAHVKDAVKLGAHAVIVMGYIGSPKESDGLERLGLVARECEDSGMPLVAEMIPVSCDKIKDPYGVEAVGIAARIGAEIGADVIKTHYTGTQDTFRQVVKGCGIPIVIAGGPKMETEEQVLRMARDALNAGAVGVAFGRNVWQNRNPSGITRALRRIVHDGSNVQMALKEVSRKPSK